MLSFNATATSNFLLRSSPSTHRQLETMLRSRHLMLFFMVMFSSNLITPAPALSREGLDLLHFKSTLYDPDNSLQDWNPSDATPCNWTGIHCSLDSSTVTSIELPDLSLNGPFHPLLCTLPSLTHLDLSFNYINSTLLPSSLLPCSSLTHLKLSQNLLVGALPSTLPDLPSLRWLDLSGNNFSGDIPESFARFPKLEGLSLVQNLLNGTVPGFLGNITSLKDLNLSFNPFSAGVLPSEFGNLSSLETLWVAGCNLIGVIPSSIGDLRSLRNFDVSRNELEGRIPETMTRLSSVFQIELFANNLAGEIPNGFGNLTLLRNFDASMNRLQGTIPSDIFDLPLLQSLNLYQNQLFGEIPAAIVKVKTLRELRLFQNNLTGVIPSDLGKNQPLVFVDISQNRLSGEIPNGICDMGLLEYLMTIDNNLSGGLPESLKRCKTMRRLRLSKNFLSGDVPDGVWSLPHVSLFDLAVNSLTGNISEAISGAYNISSLIIFDNNFTGRIPKELGTLSKLETLSAGGNHLIGPLPASIRHLSDLSKLDLHDNDLSGQLPTEIGSLARLTELNLGKNRFTGKIPSEIGNLPVLNYLDLSNNELTGEIPRELQNLTLNSFNFSNNQLSGTIPPLYADESYKDRFVGNPGLCAAMADLCPRQNTKNNRKKANAWILCMIFVLTGIVMVVGLGWFYSRYRNLKRSKKESKNASKWTVTSFHKLDFVEYEILDNLDEDNLIGTGASGNVYKVPLMNGGTVAVKKIWSKSKKPGIDGNQGEQEQEEARDLGDDSFEAEVSTLGKIRHKCIVKLWCCCTHNDSKSKLLVYEHMANGSLGDLLHGKKKGVLDWHTRHRIAVDAAEGLSYLHHDCVPAIVHRDVKSNNILLDSELRGKVADFGVAKTFEVVGKCPKSMSVIAGSCGYIAPEYAYTLRVNEKSDIYSFGVVILELVTGRAAVDPKFGEKDLVKWVRGLLEEENGVEIAVDPKLDLKSFKDEISKVLDIGLQCTSTLPINRPSMRRVVKMLLQVTDGNQVSDGGRYSNNPKKIQSPYYYDYEQDV